MVRAQCTADVVRSFLACVFEPDDIIEFRCVVPREVKQARERAGLPEAPTPSQWHKVSDLLADDALLSKLVEWLRGHNDDPELRYNIFFGANPRNRVGGKSKDDVQFYRNVFCDIDGVDDLSDVQQRIIDAELKANPNATVMSGHGFQVWYRLDEPVDKETGYKLCDRLSHNLNGDSAVKDAARCMRVPGFWNRKSEPHVQAHLVGEPMMTHRHGTAMFERLPERPATRKASPNQLPAMPDVSNLDATERIEQATRYMAKVPGTTEGGDPPRNVLGYQVAATLHRGFALGAEPAWELFRAWNAKNTPPLDDGEAREVFNNAGRYATGEHGSKLRAKTFPLTEVGNGERFAAKYTARVRFCEEEACWLYYDGVNWNAKTGKRKAHRLMVETIRNIATEAYQLDGNSEKTRMLHWSASCESKARIENSLSEAAKIEQIAVHADQLDQDKWLLNCLNGTVDLRTGRLRAHDPNDLITKVCPVPYDALARSELWERHLKTVTQGNAALEKYIQVSLGYALCGDCREEHLWMVYGPAASGKSTTIQAVQAVMGDYARVADFTTFLKKRQDRVRDDIARLRGARLVVSLEVDRGETLAEGLLKSITGGDRIAARPLYGKYHEFVPQFSLFLVCNDRPKIDDLDSGMWRRVRVLPFEHPIPEDERDPAVKAELIDVKKSGPAILAWLVRGCVAWHQDGMVEPDVVRQATEAYKDAMNPLKGFLEDEVEIVTDANAVIPTRALFQIYLAWAREQGIRYPMRDADFTDRLKKAGYEKRKVKNTKIGQAKCWIGIRANRGWSRDSQGDWIVREDGTDFLPEEAA